MLNIIIQFIGVYRYFLLRIPLSSFSARHERMLKKVYAIRDDELTLEQLIRKQDYIISRRRYYEITYWFSIVLITYVNNVLLETMVDGAFCSIIVLAILMVLSTFLFYIR